MDVKLFFEIPENIKPRIRELKYSITLLRKNTLSFIGALIILIFLFIAVFAPILSPYPEHSGPVTDIQNQLQPPGGNYLMGTDQLGRDILSRLIYGTRISLIAGTSAIGLALLIGVPLGAIAGAFGGYVDEVIMRVVDTFLSFPPLLLALAITAALGPSLRNAIIAIAVTWWPWYTRIIRGDAQSVKERPFVEAAEAIGESRLKIAFRHILPNSITGVIVQSSMDFGSVIITLASLSFLGLGAQPPTPEWGLMITSGREYFLTNPWVATFPGIAIFIMVFAFNVFGDGLRDIIDPRTRRR
ncbi:MAG: ABC transporter permease [Candidatus Saliniplasma sp.]